MSGQTMTIREIAELCGVSESTVRNWIDIASASAKIAKPSAETAKAENKPFSFTLPETLAIIRAGGKNTLADLLAENAKVPSNKELDISRKMSGSFIRELNRMYGAPEASKRFDFLIGYHVPLNSNSVQLIRSATRAIPAQKRESLLDQSFPTRDIFLVAKLIGRPVEWIVPACRKLSIPATKWDKQDVYFLLAKSRGVPSRLIGGTELDNEIQKMEALR
jgi:hypothetical protein